MVLIVQLALIPLVMLVLLLKLSQYQAQSKTNVSLALKSMVLTAQLALILSVQHSARSLWNWMPSLL